jgi:hypothetical protein
MTLRYSAALLLAAFALVLPVAAIAAVPSPPNSTVPAYLVGSPDGAFVSTVTVRDIANNPVGGAIVVLEFYDCPDFKPCPTACTACLVNPYSRTITLQANAAGVASFNLRVGDSGCPNPPYLHVYADGVLLGSTVFASLDQDGDLSVTAADVGIVISKLGSLDLRADFDGDQVVTAADVAIVQAHVGATCDNVTETRRGSWGALKTIYR